MSRPKRQTVKKTKVELLEDLVEQIELLVAYCQAFDEGRTSMAKPISAALKILLYGDQGKSLALLHQLGLRQKKFANTARPFPLNSRFPQCQLAGIHIQEDSQARYVPLLSDIPHAIEKTDFVDWWTAPVIRDLRNRTFSRLDIVKEVRDTDGGGHLDAELGVTYSDFKSGRYMGWKLKTDGGLVPIPHPHLACLRQIAHETLLTLQEIAADQFLASYVFPAKPMEGVSGVFLFGAQVIGTAGTTAPIIKVGNTELIGEV